MTDQFIFNLFEFFIVLGFVPVAIMFLQYFLVGLNRYYSHYSKCEPYSPRISVIIPSWNEGDVVARTVDTLLRSNYDRDKLRIFLVDDASTDDTPAVARTLQAKYPTTFFYLRREEGGQGKAHTLNYALKKVLSDDWAQAILIVDADILFDINAINKMVRHLSDPKIGCVTCYIKEGTRPGTLINRFIAYEYIISEAVVRRSQNVLGVLACVAGGAQLHSRANIEALGGEIDGSTFAEDTHTTFMTQILGNKAIFDGNAVVRSEEPTTITGLWRQRKRWGRGNVQLTTIFKKIWFHFRNPSGLGGIFFGTVWFSILLLPFLMILVSIGLLGTLLYYPGRIWTIFTWLGGVSVFIYLFISLYTFFVDSKTMKRSWFAALLFPGLISLFSMVVAFAPHFFGSLFRGWLGDTSFAYWEYIFLLFVSFWVSGCMFFAWAMYRLDRAGVPQFLTNLLLIIIGYGPLLCIMTLSAFYAQITKREMKWDKTVKTGSVPLEPKMQIEKYEFSEALEHDQKIENKLFLKELLLFVLLIILFFLRYYFEF